MECEALKLVQCAMFYVVLVFISKRPPMIKASIGKLHIHRSPTPAPSSDGIAPGVEFTRRC